MTEKNTAAPAAEEQLLFLLRKCGHFLHHDAGRDANAAELLGVLTEEEKSSLEAILKKCLEHWKG